MGIFVCLLAGLRQPARGSLTIEQIPEIRGSIMSLNSASGNVGGMVGAAIASFLLLKCG